MRAVLLITTMIVLGLRPYSTLRADDVEKPVASELAASDTKTPPPTITASIDSHSAKRLVPGSSDPFESWSVGYLNVQPILSRACGDCHASEDAEGGFDLTSLYRDDAVHLDRTQTRSLLRVISQHEMPPEGSGELSEAERQTLESWLGSRPVQQSECNQIASDESAPWYRGYVMSRRLTRAEYNNCIRDLTTLDYLRFQNDFPADGAGGEGFDTHGATLFTSPILMEKLLASANRTIEEAVPDTELGVSSERLHARRKILTVMPSDDLPEAAAARRILATFAERAWRRPVEPEEVDRLVALYQSQRSADVAFVPAVKMPLKAILLSPHFLFVAEQAPADLASQSGKHSDVRRISGPEMAQRLAMFLWSTMPDERLRRLAESEAIFEPETLRREVRRMLADDRSRGLAENFGLQWLGLTELNSMLRPDAELFPTFNPQLAESMREEAVRLLLDTFKQNRSILDLLDTPYTYVNRRLAEHYDFDVERIDFGDDDFVRVTIDPLSGRGGIITLGGVLATTSYPHRTSPVLRGQWILDTILGSPVAAPPENVPPLDESTASHVASFRERLAEHRRNPACAACHAKMDPLGFGLEAFDAIGRRRNEDAGLPIDSSGELPDGTRFDGASELKLVLLSRRDDFARHLARKMLGYAMGRELNEFDDCTIDRAIQAMQRDGYRIGAAVEEIATSYAFQHRYFKR